MDEGICDVCGIEDGHRSDCEIRLARKHGGGVNNDRERLIVELMRFSLGDHDVQAIIRAVLGSLGAADLSYLNTEELVELHDAVKTFVGEAPPLAEGDPARGIL